jgi:F0F1-type ATP synthase assembly protein I
MTTATNETATHNQITMPHQDKTTDDAQSNTNNKFDYSKMKLGMGLGIVIGVIIGALIDNTSTGIAIGVAIGAGIGTVMGRSGSGNSEKK